MAWTETTHQTYECKSERYQSDLADAAWTMAKGLFGGSPRKWPLHMIVNAILHVHRSGEDPVKTVGGGEFTVRIKAGQINIYDGAGGIAKVTTPGAKQSNSAIHVIDRVLLPNAREQVAVFTYLNAIFCDFEL